MKALTFKRYGKSPDIGFADIPRPTHEKQNGLKGVVMLALRRSA